MIPRHEDRDHRPVLLVVLGRCPRTRGAPGPLSRAARRRGEDRHRPRSARAAYQRTAPAARAARASAHVRDPRRPLGDRPGERRASQHRLEPGPGLQDQETPRSLQVRLLLTRLRVPDDGIDALGYVSEEERTQELLEAKAFVAPSLGGESFGMVLTEAFACAAPVVASDIPGYRDVMTPETGVLVPPDDPRLLAEAAISLLGDEPRRQQLASGARRRARAYSWDDIARRLLAIYEPLAGARTAALAAAG